MKTLLLSLLILSMSAIGSEESYQSVTIEKNKYLVGLTWLNGPNYGEKSHFDLRFWSSKGGDWLLEAPNYEIQIYPWMIMANGHNHGGPKMTVENEKPGVYVIRDARFFMGGMKGYWQVRVDFKTADQTHATLEFKVPEKKSEK